MNLYKSILVLTVFLLSCKQSCATDTLTLNYYLELISQNYPLIKKANLYNEFVDAYALKGNGTFDPKLASNIESKDFGGTDYFNVWQTQVKVPTRFPVDLEMGYERNNGSFLNDQNTVPANGLLYGTLNLSLIRGLMFDEQRYNLQLMDLQGTKSQIERDLLIREILYSAIESYTGWSAAQNKYEILLKYRQAQNERYTNSILLYQNGDKPAMDTIEAKVYLNTADKILLDASLDLVNKKQKLALFLWNSEGEPLVLLDEVRPQELISLMDELSILSEMENPNFRKDPLLQKIDNEIEALKLSNRLERENLKPQLDLKYNAIVNMGKEDFAPSFNVNDYKYGVTVEVPILNRKTRGQIQLNKLQIQQSKLDSKQYYQTLLNKYQNVRMSQAIQQDIINVAREKVNNYEALRNAESLKFDLGESSVFMVNQRERNLFEAQVELTSSYLKMVKLVSELYYLRLGQR